MHPSISKATASILSMIHALVGTGVNLTRVAPFHVVDMSRIRKAFIHLFVMATF